MTTETMAAGREMDALVAERVMGWAPGDFRYHCEERGEEGGYASFGPVQGGYTLAEAESKCAAENAHGRQFRPVVDNVEPYSSDVAAAWEVVDAMLARGLRTGVFVDDVGAEVHVGGIGQIAAVIAHADTAPLAICRAALAAVAALTAEGGEVGRG